MGKKYAVIAAALLGTALAAPAGAQERVDLQAGFTPDPFAIGVTPGGATEVDTDMGADCVGYITDLPSIRLRYTAGREELFISARSQIDTVLVVRSPSGQITCSDDRGDSLDPGVSFDDPESGTYEIHVGTYDGDESGSATVFISEIGFDALPPEWEDARDEVESDEDHHDEEDHGPAGEHGRP